MDWELLLSRTQQEKSEGFYRVAAGGRALKPRVDAGKSPKKDTNRGVLQSEGGGEDVSRSARVDGEGVGDDVVDLREDSDD